jgi:hypothetical protein
VYRLCIGHSTDGFPLGEHEEGCGQAIENTPETCLFHPIPWERVEFFNAISQYVLYCIRNHYLGLLFKGEYDGRQ